MKHLRTYSGLLSLVALFILFACTAQAQTQIRVLAYPFPPFLNEDNRTGLTTDLIALLNNLQTDYHFELKVTSPTRRYKQFAAGHADIIFFEMPTWGWQKTTLGFQQTKEIMKGGEKYVTANQKGRDQSFFDDLTSKSISAYIGYHYGFANFNADQNWLRQNFRIGLHNSHERILDLILKNKVDIGVVTLSYLKKHFYANPQLRSKLLISDRFDQHYSLRALVRNGAQIKASQLEHLLDRLKQNKQLRGLFIANGLEDQLTY
ncbi:MAG: amino acid ABC transporter substrate-binding protein [Terasakiella sp.]|uniref:amino acid ABC transporter substrate-binding protein n=1 Tax=unclassified Terasakiella TaxID=2614952 RepID=UPI003B000583